LGRVQLSKLDRNNERRRSLTALYREQLQELVPTIVVPFNETRGISACHLLPILLPPGSNRLGFMEHMKSHGIQTSIHYPPIHKFQAFAGTGLGGGDLPVTENVTGRQVTLPLYPTLKDEEVMVVVQAVHGAFHRT
jgi:dTDP-4-amino-4,6-dideoxygalactose transaminase